MDIDSSNFFCRAFPSLQPASGGVVVCVNAGAPIWNVLRETFQVNSIGDFLKHLFNTHDGEAMMGPSGDLMDGSKF